jgi:hypothetical protein
MGHQLSVRPSDPPPRQACARSKDVADRSGGPGMPGSACDLAVANNLPTPEVANHLPYGLDEGRLLGHASWIRLSTRATEPLESVWNALGYANNAAVARHVLVDPLR